MEDFLLDSIGGLVASIEEFRVSELLRDPAGAVRSAAAADTLTQNATQLVGIVKSWNSKVQSSKMKTDCQVTNDVVEAVFSSLHRWLNCKSLAARKSIRSSKPSSRSSVQQVNEKEWSSYLSSDPWEDCDDLVAEDLTAWLVEGCREEAPVRTDKSGSAMALKPVTLLTPRHSTETVSTIAPSESILSSRSTNRSLGSTCSSSFSYGIAPQSNDKDDKRVVLDFFLSRELMPVVSLDDPRTPAHSSCRLPVRVVSTPHDAADQAPVKKSCSHLLNPILDLDID
jgi:hypothetical protein